jgi:hypothetical protein
MDAGKQGQKQPVLLAALNADPFDFAHADIVVTPIIKPACLADRGAEQRPFVVALDAREMLLHERQSGEFSDAQYTVWLGSECREPHHRSEPRLGDWGRGMNQMGLAGSGWVGSGLRK